MAANASPIAIDWYEQHTNRLQVHFPVGIATRLRTHFGLGGVIKKESSFRQGIDVGRRNTILIQVPNPVIHIVNGNEKNVWRRGSLQL